jgi:hypothetical protein
MPITPTNCFNPTRPTSLSGAPPALRLLAQKKECMHESNTIQYMRVNLGKKCVAVSIFKWFISFINLGTMQLDT